RIPACSLRQGMMTVMLCPLYMLDLSAHEQSRIRAIIHLSREKLAALFRSRCFPPTSTSRCPVHSEETATQTQVRGRRMTCLFWAVACTFTGLAWQLLTVHYNYKGNLTSLFCTGSSRPIPPLLFSENIYVF